MPIKLIHKSLAIINEKAFFYINFSSIVTQQKKNNSFLFQLCMSSLYLFWLTQVCILTMVLTLRHDSEHWGS